MVEGSIDREKIGKRLLWEEERKVGLGVNKVMLSLDRRNCLR
jgi:hypothetical protein